MNTQDICLADTLAIEVSPAAEQETIIYQTRVITDIIADMDLKQMKVLDKIVQIVQPEIKDVAVFSCKTINQIDLLRPNPQTGLYDIPVQLKDFDVAHQYYNQLRETLKSLVTLPIQMKAYQGDLMVWEGFTTLLAGVRIDYGTKRVVRNRETGNFDVLPNPVPQLGYRKREVILEFRRDILEAMIAGGPNGYIQLVKESLSMMISIYANRIYKLISGFYNEGIKNGINPVCCISIENFRKKMGLNDACEYTPVRNDAGEILRYVYTPRTKKIGSNIVEDTRLYKNIRDLKYSVLEVGKKELKKKSNIYFDYRLINSAGVKVPDVKATHIEFTVLRKQKGQLNLQTNANYVLTVLRGIYPEGKFPVDVNNIITQDNALTLRETVVKAYEDICASTSHDVTLSIRQHLTRFLKKL